MTFQVVQGQVEIYEFSRGFREVEINGKWVSGGFGNAIARSNYGSGLIEEIPEPIRNTVDYGNNHENLLGIPTAYNPPEDGVSLIAREIDDQYSILAVANKQDEDKGRTEIVGYRYFWLDKGSEINSRNPNMDGVGTLLHWWLLSNSDSLQYVFDMNPSSFRKEQLIYDEYLIDSQTNNSNIRNYPIYPVIFELQTSELIDLHKLAVLEAKRLGIRLAWAWNVRRLEFPEMYIAIWYADEAAKKAIEVDLQRIGVNKDQSISKMASTTASWASQRRDNVSLNVDEKIVEKFLLDFGFVPSHENAKKIINLISSSNVEWDKFFAKNNQYIKYLETDGNPPDYAILYAAWEPILAPQNIIIWLNWLREPQNQKQSGSFFKTHSIIDKSAQKDELYKKLIHEGISSLLNALLSSQIDYESCKWLLVDKKNSLWAKEFNQYNYNFLDYLSNPQSQIRPESYGDRTQALWEDLNRNYLKQFQPQNIEASKIERRYLAELFRDKFKSQGNAITILLNQTDQKRLKICCLSALFYQYSEGNIPSDIFVPIEDNRAYFDLMTRLLNQNKPLERMKWVRKTRDISLLVIALLIIIGGLGAALVYLYQLANIYAIHPWQLSPKPSLKDTITKCQNIELNSFSEDKKPPQTKEITECKKELDTLLTGEENKLKKLKDNPEVTSESDKTSIRLAGTYKYLKTSFVNNYLESAQDNDQYVLVVLRFLKKSVKNDVKYDDILKPLQNCKAKDKLKEFEQCARELP